MGNVSKKSENSIVKHYNEKKCKTFVMGVRNDAGKSLILQEKTERIFYKERMKTGTQFAVYIVI